MASYEENKALYGAARARQMEREGAAAPAPQPAAAAPMGAPAASQSPWGGTYGTANDMGAFQNWYNQQQGGNRPEDMDRFLQTDTLNRWNPYLITSGEHAGQYRSSRGAEGYFDKPTECPPGMYPGGPDERDPCVGGGGQTAPKQTVAQATGQAPAGQLGGLGPMMAQLQGQMPVAQQPASAPQPLAQSVAPLQSSLQGLMGGMQSQSGNTGVAGAVKPAAGWSSTQGGLQNMMAPLQKQKKVGSWF